MPQELSTEQYSNSKAYLTSPTSTPPVRVQYRCRKTVDIKYCRRRVRFDDSGTGPGRHHNQDFRCREADRFPHRSDLFMKRQSQGKISPHYNLCVSLNDI
ncbi:hypothetical protein NDU88_000358 [Pleurodeles waltl]|uniref:Uncharacterized protein n=1 Tax=Pleurodeles waltl TaxID=8319 RepID=A0AAV7U4X6_PLEWA|nr:hypothetical protein NDU88_000358 [Pleurodeles waltl]